MTVTEALFEPLLAAAPARPFITHYDDAAGTRVELSRVTMANWAAKTANLLRDELDVEPGMPVAVLLPAHWQTAGVLLGAWWCGARITDEVSGAAVAFVPPGAEAAGADVVAVVALDPLGRGLDSPPTGGAVDYLNDARVHPDDFTPWETVPGSGPALLGSTVDEVVALARQRATDLALGEDSRVLSTLDWTLSGGLVDGLLAVLAAGASLVQCSNVDPTKLPARRTSERITTTLRDV